MAQIDQNIDNMLNFTFERDLPEDCEINERTHCWQCSI